MNDQDFLTHLKQLKKQASLLRNRSCTLEQAFEAIEHFVEKFTATLKESEGRYRTLFESSPDGILVADRQTKRFLYANPAICKMLGYNRAELEVMAVDNIHPKKDLPHVTATFQAQARGDISLATDIPMLRKDGTVFHAEINSVYIDVDGKAHLLGFFRDVSERKQMEELLRESKERFRSLVENTSDWLWEVDRNGVYVYVSPKVKELLGYAPEEVRGKTPFDFMAPDDVERVKKEFATAVKRGKSFSGLENWNLHKDGRRVLLETSGVPILDPQGRLAGYRGIDRDVTDRKKAEEDIRQYQKRLQSLAVDLSLAEDQERRRLASSLHDNTGQLLSLAKIKLSTLDELSLSAEGKESLAEIEQLVTQAEQYTRTLTFQIYNPVLHDLGFEPAVEWLAENIQESYGLKVDLADDGQHKPMDEPLRVVMFQCLREVLINAAKHAKVDRARVGVARHRRFVQVTIKDEGVGFDPQASFTEKRGFGLFSVRERITQLGGYVEIKSAPGQGTTVILEGPISTDKHKTTRKKP